jgi:hypothetical protein
LERGKATSAALSQFDAASVRLHQPVRQPVWGCLWPLFAQWRLHRSSASCEGLRSAIVLEPSTLLHFQQTVMRYTKQFGADSETWQYATRQSYHPSS